MIVIRLKNKIFQPAICLFEPKLSDYEKGMVINMIQEYQYVYEVYKEKSFTKAAKNLYISQPSLSASIKKIESNLNYKIFDRSTNNLSLTEEGHYYIEIAKRILDAEKDLEIYIHELSQLELGNLTISGTALFSSCIIPYIINTFNNLYPKISLNFYEADSVTLYEEALKDQVDLIIDAGFYNSEQFSKETLFYENILLAIPLSNPLVDIYNLNSIGFTGNDIFHNRHMLPDAPTVDLSLVENENFILLQSGHDLHKRAYTFCKDAGFIPNCHIFHNQLMTVYHTSSKGLGCSFITDTLVKHSFTDAPLLYFNIQTFRLDLTKREVFIAYRKGAHLTHAAKKFIHTSQTISIFE